MPSKRYTNAERIGRTVSEAQAARGCFDKMWFPSRNAARDKAARVKAQTGDEQKPYRCPVCSGWHLTTVFRQRERKAA